MPYATHDGVCIYYVLRARRQRPTDLGRPPLHRRWSLGLLTSSPCAWRRADEGTPVQEVG
jgi:hypothetical protein